MKKILEKGIFRPYYENPEDNKNELRKCLARMLKVLWSRKQHIDDTRGYISIKFIMGAPNYNVLMNCFEPDLESIQISCNNATYFIWKNEIFLDQINPETCDISVELYYDVSKDEIDYMIYCANMFRNNTSTTPVLNIKKVIFHKPATVVYWTDGSKTVVKVNKGERWDPEKGLAMAIIKKKYGLKQFLKYMEELK